jgi:hypothetical protein
VSNPDPLEHDVIRDFNAALVAIGGHNLADADGAGLTLGTVAINALLGTYPDEQTSGEEKFKRYQLAERISTAGAQEVSVEEVALIKRLIGKGYPPMVVGPAWLALENDPAPAEPSPA